MTNGYVPLRRGIVQHVRNGSLSHGEALAYMVIIASADPATGIWYGSAKALAGEFNFSEREARRLLESLERKGYLRRFPKPGSHSNYPIAINKFEATVGARRGTRLCTAKSTSSENLVYENGEHKSEETSEHKSEHTASIKEIERERERENNNSVATSPSASAAGRNGSGKHHGQDDYLTIARKVFAYYLQALAKNQALYRFTDKRRQMLKARAREAIEIGKNLNPDLKGPTLTAAATEAMCRCVDAIRRSPFHMGQNDRAKVYADLQHVFGSPERMEKWMGEG